MNDSFHRFFPQGEPNDPQPRNLSAERLRIAFTALAVASVIPVTSILQVLLHSLFSAAVPAIVTEEWYRQTVSVLPMYLIAMPLSLLLFSLTTAEPPQKQKLSMPVFFGLMAVCFALTYVGNLIGTCVNVILSALTGTPMINEVEQMTMSTPLWWNLLFVGILPPVMEEIFYRKLVIDRLRPCGEVSAILLSGIGFGLLHGNFGQFFYAAMLGIVFGYIYLRTGKLRYTIALHMAINLIGGVFSTEVYKLLNMEQVSADPVGAATENPVGVILLFAYLAFLLIVCMAGVVCAIVLAVRWFRTPTPPAHPLRRNEWARVLLLNPGVWIFLLVVGMLFLL